MRSCIHFIVLALIACVSPGIKAFPPFSGDVLMFLPFLRHYVPPPPCPVNELYTNCAGQCSDCVQRGKCKITTCISACECAPRFYRVTPGGPCEPVANCPKPECGENETFRECGPICERCTNLMCRVIHCDYKCYCNEGYLRNAEGKCVPKEECPIRKRCLHNEEWADIGPMDEFCLSIQNATLKNETQKVSQCYCKEGYQRNGLGSCINETFCSHVKCYGNETYHSCIPKCNTTCRNYGNTECEEDGNCYPGCFCKPGFIMNDFRACISKNECSLALSQVKIIEPEMEEDESGNQTTIGTLSADSDNTTTNLDMDESTESDITWTLETLDSETTESGWQETSYESTDDEASDLGQSNDFVRTAASGTYEVTLSQSSTAYPSEDTSVIDQSQASTEFETSEIDDGPKPQAVSESKTERSSDSGQSQASAQSEASETSADGQSQALAQSEASGTSEIGQAFAQSGTSGTSGPEQLAKPEAGDTYKFGYSQSSASGASEAYSESRASEIPSSGLSQVLSHSKTDKISESGQSKTSAESDANENSKAKNPQTKAEDYGQDINM